MVILFYLGVFHQFLEVVEGEGLGPVALGLVGVGVDLYKEAVGTSGHRCEGDGRHQVPFSSAVAGVSNDW